MNRSRTLTTRRAPVLALLALLATVGLAGPGAGASLASAHTGARARPASTCVPKTLKVEGHDALRECGPATAMLSLGHHTYRFKGGACERAGHDYLVALGTLVEGDPRHNGGKASFDLDLTKKTKGLLEAYVGGHALTITVPLVSASTDSATHGRFSSRHEAGASLTYHGSWNCHGSVEKLR